MSPDGFEMLAWGCSMWLFLPPLLVLAFLPHMWRAAWRASRDTYGQANTRGRS